MCVAPPQETGCSLMGWKGSACSQVSSMPGPGEGAQWPWVGPLWLCVVRGGLSALELWGAKWWGSCFWTVEGAAGP